MDCTYHHPPTPPDRKSKSSPEFHTRNKMDYPSSQNCFIQHRVTLSLESIPGRTGAEDILDRMPDYHSQNPTITCQTTSSESVHWSLSWPNESICSAWSRVTLIWQLIYPLKSENSNLVILKGSLTQEVRTWQLKTYSRNRVWFWDQNKYRV